MKLLAIIENVNQPENEYLIGDIVIVDSEPVVSGDYKLCYQELEHDRAYCPYTDVISLEDINLRKWINSNFEIKHEVTNIEIIGVL